MTQGRVKHLLAYGREMTPVRWLRNLVQNLTAVQATTATAPETVHEVEPCVGSPADLMTTPGEQHAPSFVAIFWRRPGAGGVGSGRSAGGATRFARRQARPRVRHGVQRRRPRSPEEVP